jgi:hypothetical protein
MHDGPAKARYPSGKGEVCKTFMRGFDPHPRLHFQRKYPENMSFEIASTGETRLLRAVASAEIPGEFADDAGRLYSARFDGCHVMFEDGTTSYVGRWLQGTAATVIPSGAGLGDRFTFTFMDHGLRPQRLHALWSFDGTTSEAIASWQAAGFSVSRVDRILNRNHPAAIHLRTRGAFPTGADSSHAIIPIEQTGNSTNGDIHVGEFNPLTGLGVGFVLHHLVEGWIGRRQSKYPRRSPDAVTSAIPSAPCHDKSAN